MALVLADIKKQYASDKNLKEKSVEEIVIWAKNQPHLPVIHEIQAALFLQKTNYNIQDAKKEVDTYFTFRTIFCDTFLGRNPLEPSLQKVFNTQFSAILPHKTPEGYSIHFIKWIDSGINNWDVHNFAKYFDMVASLHLHQEGASKGYIFIMDVWGMPYKILSMLTPTLLRQFFHDLQVIIPWTTKSYHVFNTLPFLSEFIALIKPFFGKHMAANFHVHSTVDELVEYVPRKCLPRDYGGSLEPIAILHEHAKKKFVENAEFFKWEDQQTVDESKRRDVKNGSYFENDSSFKNWEID